MSDYSSESPVRILFSGGVTIKKYLFPLLSAGIKKIKESRKDPFSFMGIISIILIFIFSTALFLKSFSGEESNSSCLLADISFLAASSDVFPETPSQNNFLITASKFSVESPNFLLVEKNSLRAAAPPTMVSAQVLGTMVADYEPKIERKSIGEHIVEQGDTLSVLAEKFNVSADTIRWANDLKDARIRVGQKLVIPPVSGVIHHVKPGDTISGIAASYKGKTAEIIAFNDLNNESDIYIGDIIIIPGGIIPAPTVKPVAAVQASSAQAPISSAYFIAPTRGQISQGLHWHNAIDFSNACGALVFASAQGTVQRVSYGWNNGYGNLLTILHPNGVVTLYAHLSQISVTSGTNVSQGTIIGRVGNTGRTVGATGCHVHFEVRGARNPFAGYRLGTRF